MKKRYELALVAVAAVSMIGAGCAKKNVAVATPPSPARSESTPSRTPPPARPERTQPRPAQQAATPSTPRVPNAATKARIDELLAKIEDAYFDYDKHTLRSDAITALQSDSAELRDILKDYPDYKLTIEGHCDERGSEEYNMALGDQRARAAKDYLTQVGIPADQLSLISYGKEHPVCSDHDEACWQKNRRVHIVALAK
ncbi:MAG TPA: peptidoglycan-associated lipoprotein Pal [Bryobacteraceae bacterium]|jgi:peptidoglycan-associated lipoprotein